MKPKNLDAFLDKLNKLNFAEPDENTSRIIQDAIRVTDVFIKAYKLKIDLAKQIQQRPSEPTVEFVNP